jgi:hypothetical protein
MHRLMFCFVVAAACTLFILAAQGEPVDKTCAETGHGTGVFTRKWTKATATMVRQRNQSWHAALCRSVLRRRQDLTNVCPPQDCNSYKGTIKMK